MFATSHLRLVLSLAVFYILLWGALLAHPKLFSWGRGRGWWWGRRWALTWWGLARWRVTPSSLPCTLRSLWATILGLRGWRDALLSLARMTVFFLRLLIVFSTFTLRHHYLSGLIALFLLRIWRLFHLSLWLMSYLLRSASHPLFLLQGGVLGWLLVSRVLLAGYCERIRLATTLLVRVVP